MLQALLAERFTLALHKDARPMSGYTLTLGKNKHKLKEAGGPGAGCQGNPANGYIRVPVEDKTGLDGAYDFTLMFSGIGLLNAGRGRGGDAAGPAGADAVDPSGALSLFDAVNRQLGLKLEMRKRLMPVLVIDSVQEKPTDD